jgi:hypothetical protein
MKGYRGYLAVFKDAFKKFKSFKPFKTFPDPFDGLNDLNGLYVPNEILFADLIVIANDDGDEFFRLEIALGDP